MIKIDGVEHHHMYSYVYGNAAVHEDKTHGVRTISLHSTKFWKDDDCSCNAHFSGGTCGLSTGLSTSCMKHMVKYKEWIRLGGKVDNHCIPAEERDQVALLKEHGWDQYPDTAWGQMYTNLVGEDTNGS